MTRSGKRQAVCGIEEPRHDGNEAGGLGKHARKTKEKKVLDRRIRLLVRSTCQEPHVKNIVDDTAHPGSDMTRRQWFEEAVSSGDRGRFRTVCADIQRKYERGGPRGRTLWAELWRSLEGDDPG